MSMEGLGQLDTMAAAAAAAPPPAALPQRSMLPRFEEYEHNTAGPFVDGIVFFVVLVLVLAVGVYQGCLHRKRKSPVQIRRCYSLVLVISYTSVVMILGKEKELFVYSRPLRIAMIESYITAVLLTFAIVFFLT